MKHLEHNLQVAVAHMLQIVLDPERTWWSSIDHGVGKLGKAEAGIRKRRGVKAGIPDIIVMARVPARSMTMGEINVGVMIGIELKTDKGELSPAQKELHYDWKRMGHDVYIARSLEEVQEILEHCRIPMRRRMVFFPKQGSPYDGGDDEPAQRPAPARHRRARRSRKSKNHLPLVLAPTAQKE